MKQKLLLLLSLLVLPLAIFAQSNHRTITGVVVSKDDGSPLPGVSIFIDNTTIGVEYGEGVVSNYARGTISNVDGKFTFILPEGVNKLTFSMIGFDNYVLDITDATEYVVLMKETMSLLNEVVVTGYQEIINRKVTASISKIKADDVIQQSAASVDQMLAGQVTGV